MIAAGDVEPFVWPDWYAEEEPHDAHHAMMVRLYSQWRDRNPWIVDGFAAACRKLLAADGVITLSSVEGHLRRPRSGAEGDGDFKVNSRHVAYLAREVMWAHSDLRGKIKTRSLHTRGRVPGVKFAIDDDLAHLDDDAEIERLEQRIDEIKARRAAGGERR